MKVIIFGGSGFIGSYVVKELAASGHTVTIFTRNLEKTNALKVHGNLGQIIPVCGDIFNRDDVFRHVNGKDVVINLVGILNESKCCSFFDAHCVAAEIIAKCAKACNVSRLIYFSALVPRDSGSIYAKSRLKGEELVSMAFQDVITLRPSVVFGPEDRFFNLFARIAKLFKMLPLINGGNTLLQPIYVADVAKFTNAILDREGIQGKTYDLVGPDVYSLRDMMMLIRDILQIRCLLIRLPYVLAMIEAWIFELFIMKPINKLITGDARPLITIDQVKMLKYDNVSDSKALADFNIEAHSLKSILPTYIM